MEKENVLEIEIIKATDKYSYWVIRKVNKIKLKKMPLTEIAHEDKKNILVIITIVVLVIIK